MLTRIIVVTGPPASGKTTLAQRISEQTVVPLITKDGIKEVLYDSLGVGDREWSRRLGGATFEVLYHVLECQLRAGKPVVVEGAFVADEANSRFAALHARSPFDALQIFCSARADVLAERYRHRAPERHTGHLDAEIAGSVSAQLDADRWQPLSLPGELLVVDTSDFGTADVDGLVQTSASYLAGR